MAGFGSISVESMAIEAIRMMAESNARSIRAAEIACYIEPSFLLPIVFS